MKKDIILEQFKIKEPKIIEIDEAPKRKPQT